MTTPQTSSPNGSRLALTGLNLVDKFRINDLHTIASEVIDAAHETPSPHRFDELRVGLHPCAGIGSTSAVSFGVNVRYVSVRGLRL